MWAGAVAALLTACGGSQSQPATTGQILAQRDPGAADRLASAPLHRDLFYVSDDATADVYAFTYPQGRHVKTWTGFDSPQGLCVDFYGDVFVTDVGALAVVEYAHGGTEPINTLSDSYSPIACTIDPISGNLAVANKTGSVSVYPRATGEPTIYSVPFVPLFCTYDTSGDLFADGTGVKIQIAELRKGSDTFKKVAYAKRNNGQPAGLQAIGRQLDVGSASPYQGRCCGKVYRFRTKGTHGTLIDTMSIRGPIVNFFTEGVTTVVTTGTDHVAFYDYPKGGHATKVIKEPGDESYGVVVSIIPSDPSQRGRTRLRR